MPTSRIVDEVALEEDLLAFIAGGRKKVPDRLAQALFDICKSIPSGYGEEWREDCVSYAAMHLVTNVVFKWEPKYGRPFNYFYTSACYAAMKEYRKQQKQRKGDTTAYHLSEGREGEMDTGEMWQETVHHLKKKRLEKRFGDRAGEELLRREEAERLSSRSPEERREERELRQETARLQREERARESARIRGEAVRARAEERKAKAERLAEVKRLRKEERQRDREEGDRRREQTRQERQQIRDEKKAKKEAEIASWEQWRAEKFRKAREEAQRREEYLAEMRKIRETAPSSGHPGKQKRQDNWRKNNFRSGDIFRMRRGLCRKLRYVVEMKRRAHFVYPHIFVGRSHGSRENPTANLGRMLESEVRGRFGIPHFTEIRLEGEEKIKETGVSLKSGENF